MAHEYITDTDADDAVPFQTEEEVEVDLSKVQSTLLPVAQNILGEITKASRDIRNEGKKKGLKLELRIVDGIPTPDADGNIQYKYRGKVVFPQSKDLLYYADPVMFNSDYYKEGVHLRGLTFFLSALGIDTRKTKVKINDEFLSSLVGRKILFSIKHVPGRSQNETGEWADDGTLKEQVYGWRKAQDE